MLKTPPHMGFYYTPYEATWLGGRDLGRGPLTKSRPPMLIEARKYCRQDVGRYKGSGFVSDASAR